MIPLIYADTLKEKRVILYLVTVNNTNDNKTNDIVFIVLFLTKGGNYVEKISLYRPRENIFFRLRFLLLIKNLL
ncbi:hypothetical protein KMU_09520 [Proteus vulgaris]|nr:hypothetical protein KMU_09520 [Proteus vulgaris]